MIGGLLSKTSRAALFAAAGLFAGGVAMPSAKAADLGGDCCADLEERVAELEATTARKGNRRVSLTVYGWVHKSVLYWNDGVDSNTHFGVDNTNYATRFGLRGEARINPNMTSGFNLLFDVITGPTTSSQTQRRENVNLSTVTSAGVSNPNAGIGTVGQFTDDGLIRLRDANVWIESKTLGRLTVGHLTSPGPQGIVDLGGTIVASNAAIDLVGGAFAFRNRANGAITGATISSTTTNVADFDRRVDGLRYDSPTLLGGFVFGAMIAGNAEVDRGIPVAAGNAAGVQNFATGEGPLGQYWAVNLRYASEMAGFRVAAAVGYEASEADRNLTSASGLGLIDGTSTNFGYSASLLHIQSGLFAQASWLRFSRPNLTGVTVGGAGSAVQTGGDDSGTLWQVQAGIAKNWFGVGNTVLYGEYARGENLQRTFSPVTGLIAANAANPSGSALPLAAAANAVNGENEYNMWGLGIVQNVDAAAMEIYLAYRRHSLDHTAETTGANANAALEDIQMVIGGMRIAF